jgi:hypothetical protein
MNISRYIYVIAFSMLTITSCTKDYLDVNKTPNNPTVVPPASQLPNTFIATAFANGNDLNRAASVLMQYNAGTANQVATYDIYNLRGNLDNQWNYELYNGAVSSCLALIKQTQETSPAYSGIAKIQLAYVISMATDLWGAVPYSQAGKGLEFIQPVFDKQEDIYQGNTTAGITSLFDLVKSALVDLKATSVLKPAVDDLVYAGDLTKWERAGNTLLLKLAMQISNVNSTLSKQIINEVIAGNAFINSNTLDLDVKFGTNVGNQNPIHSFNVNRPGDQMLSSRYLTLMNNLSDPRLGIFYTSPSGTFVAYENGAATTPPLQATRSRHNTYLTGLSGEAPVHLLTNSQRAFILSEAVLILGTPGDAQALFQEGIRASMSKTGLTTAEIDAYFLLHPAVVTLTGSVEAQRKQIIIQKYISFTGNGIEAYNDYRRTGYPELQLALNAQGDDPNSIPKRLPYTSDEISRNPNVPTPAPLTSAKVWWAK